MLARMGEGKNGGLTYKAPTIYQDFVEWPDVEALYYYTRRSCSTCGLGMLSGRDFEAKIKSRSVWKR